MHTTLTYESARPANPKAMSRYKAAAIHFGISLAIAAAVLMVMLKVWYPQPYFEAVGGDVLLLLIFSVDITLGPLITLIIFDIKKKSLKFDLSVIAIIQTAALVYGVYAMFQARPVYTVFVKDQFKIVTANELENEQLAKVKRPEFKSLPITGPVVVAVLEPTDAKELEYLATGAMFGMDLQFFPQYFHQYREVQTKILTHARSLAELRKSNPSGYQQIETALAEMNKGLNAVVFLPCKSKHKALIALLDSKTGEIIKILPVRSAL